MNQHIVTTKDESSSSMMKTTSKNDRRPPPPNGASIRHIEKRRTSTCQFADRIAQVSIEYYRKLIVSQQQQKKQGEEQAEQQQQPPESTCLATIVAYNNTNDTLRILGMGVGTKFLQESVLRQEEEEETIESANDGEAKEKEVTTTDESQGSTSSPKTVCYGRRIRDCHAEVLARRAFRRTITLEMQRHLRSSSTKRQSSESFDILTMMKHQNDGRVLFALKDNITLHFYASSAPCGNATLKKFAKMKTEKYRDDLGPKEWPTNTHDPINDGSITLGQFALLIKKDNTASSTTATATTTTTTPTTDNNDRNGDNNIFDRRKRPIDALSNDSCAGESGNSRNLNQLRQLPPPSSSSVDKFCQFLKSDDWCPPGTTTVVTNKGSMHSCSDKLCRWNVLGIQGSLLFSLLQHPLYVSTLTVGRKFTECICRRAVCCRLERKISNKKKNKHNENRNAPFRIHHPTIMGTAVYMDDGAMESNTDVFGQDVRFHSSQSWACWPSSSSNAESHHTSNKRDDDMHNNFAVECIHGTSGFLVTDMDEDKMVPDATETIDTVSELSTYSLSQLFGETYALARRQQEMDCADRKGAEAAVAVSPYLDKSASLKALRQWKRHVSPKYEKTKDDLFNNHRILRQWKRRMS